MRILITLVALALGACAGMTPQQVTGAASTGLYAAATIARAGTVDEQIAPEVTRARMIVLRTAALVKRGRLDPATAREVLASTDAAVADLAAGGTAATPAAAAVHLAGARAQLAAAEKLLELVQ